MDLSRRPSSHQIDRKSINAFTSAAPDNWVVREKDQDYGIDLEVEIFNEDTTSTGMLFYVQMKGTASASRSDTVNMKIDRINYLSHFDAPAIICRYCIDTGQMYWLWIFDALQQVSKPDAKIVRLKFSPSDLWVASTPKSIEHTLPMLRKLRSGSKSIPIDVAYDFTALDMDSRFAAQTAVSRIISSCNGFFNHSENPSAMPVYVNADNSQIRVSIGNVSSITFKHKGASYDKIMSCVLYATIYHLSHYDFHTHAKTLSRFALSEKVISPSRNLASTAIEQLCDTRYLALELAILNSIHEKQDFAYVIAINSLLSKSAPSDFNSELVTFYNKAISYQVLMGDAGPTAAIHYSLANIYMNERQCLPALHHYNQARKIENSYLEREYFYASSPQCVFGWAALKRPQLRTAAL